MQAQAPRIDRLAAFDAVSEGFVGDTLQRCPEAPALLCAALMGGLRHRLLLERIHPVEPADALLVEHYAIAIPRRHPVLVVEFGKAITDLLLELLNCL